MDFESGIEQWSALYHNSFILGHSCSRNVAWVVYEKAAGVLHPSERSDQSHSSWFDPNGLNELIHCCMPYFLVHFFLLGPAVLPLTTPEI